MREKAEPTLEFKQYQKGVDYLTQLGRYETTDTNYEFYDGDQWARCKTGGEEYPSYNIIQPIIDYKVAIVAQNAMTINYSTDSEDETNKWICNALNKNARTLWEKLKMDIITWNTTIDCGIVGNTFLYFYMKQSGGQNIGIVAEEINDGNIHFGDEQQKKIQEQPYIIIRQRRLVEDVKKEAEANGKKRADIDLILPDEDTEYEAGESAKTEVENDLKCTSILKLEKRNGVIHITRSVKNVVYEERDIEGLTMYPVCGWCWKNKKRVCSFRRSSPLVKTKSGINK